MPNPSVPSKSFSRLRRIEQISENHCGPAVIQMLLENIGVTVSQETITAAAGATDTIAENGTRVDQLARAVRALAPGARLWCKEKAALEDVVRVLDEQKYPVGVEWQGLFGENEDEFDDDYGHYSVISHVDLAKGELIVVDPYKDFADQDRILTVRVFLKRWWDDNVFKDPQTGVTTYKRDERLFFVVAPLDVAFPAELHMTPLPAD
jgi:ABC-type bacteriocin/lantibiotic exporter with double-glycine peptidase domain